VVEGAGAVEERGAGSGQFTDPSLGAFAKRASDAPTHAIPPPRCGFAALWSQAKERGASPSATATITYEAAGYDLRIDGTALALAFDHECRELRSTS
jgi:hypothetical protein